MFYTLKWHGNGIRSIPGTDSGQPKKQHQEELQVDPNDIETRIPIISAHLEDFLAHLC